MEIQTMITLNWIFLAINILIVLYFLLENKETNKTMKITKLTEQQRTEDNRIMEKREYIISYHRIMKNLKDY